MIIAIASSAGGLQPVEEFRDAATPADAVAAFCAEYTPPRDPADYLGEPTGWAAGAAQLGRSWAWDSAALDLVEVGYTSDLVGQLEAHRDERLADVVRAEYPAASGLLFSCSVAAQDSWSKLATLDDRGLVVYPFEVHTADQQSTYDLIDSADLTGAIGAVSAAVLTERAACQSAIDAVVAAPDGDAARAAAAPYLAS